jgi:hypothetical protein
VSAALRASCAALALALFAPLSVRAQAADDPLASDEGEEFEGAVPGTEQEPEPDPAEDTEASPDADAEGFSEEPLPTRRRAIALHAAVGLGVGTLSFTRPTSVGVQRLQDTAFAATEVAVRVHAFPADSFSFEVLLAYQTSVGLMLEFEPLFALPERIDVRAQRLELSGAPVLQLGGSDSRFTLAFPLGVVLRAFMPEVHEYPVEKYALAGPHLRAELWIRLGELVRLRIGPELQWIVLIDGAMRDQGACCQGVAAGGQGALEASIGPVFRVAFAYRETRSFVPAVSRFQDVERMLTARFAGEL